MIEFVTPAAEWIAAIIEMLGVFIILLLTVYALISAVVHLMMRKSPTETIYREVRQRLGQGILLGLEFLVAADIIHTVAVELTFQTVGVLAIIVLIRTFLSIALEVELTSKWPWQQNENAR